MLSIWTKFYELQGKKTINDKVVYCWGVAFINDIFRGGLLFLDHFPALRQFTLVEFLKRSFALKDTEGNANLIASEKK